ncbi:gluconate 2-dehydrogenase subunit 3 family protein [Haloparvum sedimenti]|uniref:gluconate 2-dehydrogenase subunit 3 family protein n=1 Tax=Haloparvum sedimenti TaxID=1678448 RepID=UPI00071E70CD|nr:gluconate 2-dehydrogenase subunit 3 family protein [Haloparvum sedimenti]
MELTRRDAAAALAAFGVGGVGAAGVREWRQSSAEGSEDAPVASDTAVRDALVAVAEVVYPSEVEGVPSFVESFLSGRLVDPDDAAGASEFERAHDAGLREAVTTLNDLAASWYDAPVADLPPSDRDGLLREVGADTAEASPDGTDAERVRYYVVNELLLALYASPTGGELVGIENPQGHPGGTDTYQRGPT